jgi:putative transposase
MLYLAMNDITAKWTGRSREWTRILEQLIIYFDGRISLLDVE